MNKSKINNHFRYIVEFDVPVRSRYLAYDIAALPEYEPHLIRVTDLQFNTYVYGSTYDYRAHKYAAARAARQLKKRSPWKLFAQEFIRQLKLFF